MLVRELRFTMNTNFAVGFDKSVLREAGTSGALSPRLSLHFYMPLSQHKETHYANITV